MGSGLALVWVVGIRVLAGKSRVNYDSLQEESESLRGVIIPKLLAFRVLCSRCPSL